MLEVGDTAPELSAETTQGRFDLSEADEEGAVVLFFFPKAGSRVCTKEACSFRDSTAEFNDVDATVVGVSSNDSLERLEEFAEKNSLDFPLVSDTDGEISKKYGAKGVLGLYSKRVTYVIEDGEVVGRVKGMLSADRHVEGSIEALRQI
ncbi:peroxiredoxin [Halorutilales archaeon Cl-col2-1]